MPNTVMFSNEQALRRGIERAAWKVRMGNEYFLEVKEKKKYNLEKKCFFDPREAETVAALFIDISSVANAPEDVKKAYYISELKRFEEEYILSDDETRKARFMQRLCDNLATSAEINWDDEAAIEHLALSHKTQQAPGTTVERIPFEVLSMFDNKDDAQAFDTITVKNMIYITRFSSALAGRYPDLAEMISCHDLDNADQRFRTGIVEKMHIARDNGTNQVIIDPAESDVMKKVLFGDQFEIVETKPLHSDPDPNAYEESTFDDEMAIMAFADCFYTNSQNTMNEFMTVRGYRGSVDNRKDLLFINGRTLTDIVEEKKEELRNNGGARMPENIIAGKAFRDALCAGSVISVMRPNMLPGGKVAFSYQEVKVNLDKLNELERNEKHNVFRRILDYFGIWKIQPKYPSNEQREAMQAQFKSSVEYQNSIKAAEKKFIDTYNENSRIKRAEEDELQKKSKDPIKRSPIYQAFPVVSNAADDMARDENINEPVNNHNNDLVREALPNIIGELEDDKDIEVSSPIIPEDDNAKEIGVNIK